MLSPNKSIRLKIKDLDRQRENVSYESVTYHRLTREIEILALQLEAEHHWSTTPGFWVMVVAMVAACIAAYPVVQPLLTEKPSGSSDSSHTQLHQSNSKINGANT